MQPLGPCAVTLMPSSPCVPLGSRAWNCDRLSCRGRLGPVFWMPIEGHRDADGLGVSRQAGQRHVDDRLLDRAARQDPNPEERARRWPAHSPMHRVARFAPRHRVFLSGDKPCPAARRITAARRGPPTLGSACRIAPIAIIAQWAEPRKGLRRLSRPRFVR